MSKKIFKCFTVFKRENLRLFSIVIVGSLLQCTAYFNTFYNGKGAFREANTAHMKMLRNHPDSIIVTPSSEILQKYDRSIDKSNKVLEVYKKKPRWHDDALLLMGKSFYYKRENNRAISVLNQILQEFPKSPLVPEAYFYIGKARIDMGEFDKAEKAFEIILERYPGFSDIDQISFLLVEIAIQRGGRSQAVSRLSDALKTVNSVDVRRQILLKIIELSIDLNQYEKALALLKEVPRKRVSPHQLFRTDKAYFSCYTGMEEYEKALTHVEKMFKNRLYEEFRPNLLLMKASVLKRMGRFEEAINVYLKIVNGIDTTNISSDTSTVVGKAFFELALIYQKNSGDYKSASQYADLASKSRDSTSRFKAKLLVNAFEKLIKLRGEKDSTEENKYNRLFRIGELFRFELSEPDSAYYQFMEVAATDSHKIVPMALCAAAYVARDDMNDTTRADSIFKLLLKKYPASEYAILSQKELNLVVTVKTRRDSAHEAFRNAENVLYGKEQDVKKAINGFYDVYRNYPDVDIAPKSLFVAAWLIDDVLQKNKTAKELYERICEKYPKSYYCISEAKPRLQEVTKILQESKQSKSASQLPDTAPARTATVNDSGKTEKQSETIKTETEIKNETGMRNETEMFNQEDRNEIIDVNRNEIIDEGIKETQESDSLRKE